MTDWLAQTNRMDRIGSADSLETATTTTTTTTATNDIIAMRDQLRDAKETAEDTNILKRFKIVQLIGTGNYARVYRALSASGRELAIKSINLSKTSDHYKFKFLPRELTILKRISHPNICKIHEILQVSDRVFIVMQFCSRGTIADLLHRLGPLSEPVTRYLFVPTAEALTYLHSLDYAHRDLKVENILLDQDYNPKLTDFSYSVSLSPPSHHHHHTAHPTTNTSPRASRSPSPSPINNQMRGKQQQHANSHPPNSPSPRASHTPTTPTTTTPPTKLTETFCGTLPYLSPEMVRLQPYDPKKTDIWSLGVCLFIMLNDKAPFLFEDVKVMVKKQLARDYKFRANVEFSNEVRNLLSIMLEPDYAKRTSANEVVQHPWASGPREKPASPPPPQHRDNVAAAAAAAASGSLI